MELFFDRKPKPVRENIDVEEQMEELEGQILYTKTDNIPIGNWKFPYLYKEISNGSIYVWMIGYDVDENEIIVKTGQAVTITGKKGKLTTHKREIELNNLHDNYARKAMQDMWTMYQNKYKEGYRPMHESAVSEVLPQLSVALINTNTGRWNIDDNNFTRGITVQPKLDGIRAIIWPDTMKFKSRAGNIFKWMDHIIEELIIFFTYLPDDIGLDGELYRHNMGFDMIQGIVTRTVNKHPETNKIQFYIFDIVLKETIVEERIKILYDGYSNYINDGNKPETFVIVPFTYIYSKDILIETFEYYLDNGYEGLMIRKLGGINPTKKEIESSYYKSGHNNNLIKMKKFKDTEGLILNIVSAKGNDRDTAVFYIEWNGLRFNCRPAETRETRKDLYENANDYIGRIYTFKYFETTKDGYPRFPTGKDFRDDDFFDGYGKIIKVDKYIDNVSIFTLSMQSKDVKIKDVESLNIEIINVQCIPSADKIQHNWFIQNSDSLIGKQYHFKYMKVKYNIPTDTIGIAFI